MFDKAKLQLLIGHLVKDTNRSLGLYNDKMMYGVIIDPAECVEAGDLSLTDAAWAIWAPTKEEAILKYEAATEQDLNGMGLGGLLAWTRRLDDLEIVDEEAS